MESIFYASATKLAAAISAKQVSSLEVVDAHLERIAQVNPQLNALVQLNPDVREQARRADAALGRGEVLGPLHGVPFTAKDSLETAGVVSTGGTKGLVSYVPEEDATAVKRLRGAGAILLGKTNTPEFTMGSNTDNLVYGQTNNPYDLSRSPGGSSGGEAAIIAAGGSPLGLGSDSGGSVRAPCHQCGIAGLKPTAGRVPRTGHMLPPGGLWDVFTQICPMARFVEDLGLALPIIAGVDWRDPAVVPMSLGDYHTVQLKGLRGAFYSDNGIVAPTSETVEVVKKAAMALADHGIAMDERRPPAVEWSEEINRGLLGYDAGAWARRLLEKAGTTEPAPTTARSLERRKGQVMTTAELSELIIKWDTLRARMLEFMEHYDFILCPAAARPAVPHENFLVPGSEMPTHTYTVTYNLTGWPAVVVRGGSSGEGLPIGIQVAAGPWRDDVALAVAQYLERTLEGWQPPAL